MIEQGLAQLIQAGINGIPPALNVKGGYFATLPKDQISQAAPMSWCYKSIVSDPDYILSGQTGWTEWHVQIDCHGNEAHDAITLARAIDAVLRVGFQGTLPDADETYVFGIYRLGPSLDGFSDANRSYVRSLEYRVIYQQT